MQYAVPAVMLLKTNKKNEENLCRLADRLLKNRSTILKSWKHRALADNELTVVASLSRGQFLDHIPEILDSLDDQLRSVSFEERVEQNQSQKMKIHGLSRWQQGFSVGQVVRDWNHLRCAILEEITQSVTENPDWVGEFFSSAVETLSNLIAEGINLSVEKYEEIRQDEAKGYAIDLEKTIQDLRKASDKQSKHFEDASHDLAGHLGILSTINKIFGHETHSQKHYQNLHEHLAFGFTQSLQILEDIRYHASLESGETTPTLESVDAAEIIHSTLGPYVEVARKKSLELKIDGPQQLIVETDSPKFCRIVQNLIHNAIKFTEEGKITVEWGVCDNESAWHIRIQNSGTLTPTPSAIPLGTQMVSATAADSSPNQPRSKKRREAESMERRYSREKPSLPCKPSIKLKREGIGLSIAKRLANLLMGRLEIKNSPLDYGIMATVILPIRYPRND